MSARQLAMSTLAAASLAFVAFRFGGQVWLIAIGAYSFGFFQMLFLALERES